MNSPKRLKRISTGRLKHQHWLYKIPKKLVTKLKKTSTERSCAVCGKEIMNSDVTEHSYHCNLCDDFYMCETCFKRRMYQDSLKISALDTKLVYENLREPPECKCFKCGIEIKVEYGSISYFAVDELIANDCSFIACCKCVTDGAEEKDQTESPPQDISREVISEGHNHPDHGPQLVVHPPPGIEPDPYPQRRNIKRDLQVHEAEKLRAIILEEQEGKVKATNGEERGLQSVDVQPLQLGQESYPQRGKIPRELQVLELEQRTQEVERKMTQEGTTKSEDSAICDARMEREARNASGKLQIKY